MIALFALVIGAGGAAAQPWEVPEDDDENTVTLSISPLHLTIPMMEVTGEYRLGEDSSVALIGGLGGNDGYVVWDVGGQVREYVIGDFDTGINLGVEAKWTTADYLAPDEWDYPTTGTANLGPFVGGKLTVALFTMELQGGGQLVWVPGTNDLDIGPLFNFQAGVSF